MLEISNGQGLIDQFAAMMPPKSVSVVAAPSVVTPVVAPPRIVLAIHDKIKLEEPLWDGNWSSAVDHKGVKYLSQSEADYALNSIIIRQAITSLVPEEMAADVAIRVFEQSGLYRPDKRHRVLTQDIPNLIRSQYTSSSPSQQSVASVGSNTRLKSGKIEFTDKLPPLRDYVLEDIIVANKSCVLAGLGGVSKTMWLMMLSVCVALGRNFLGKATKVGCVLLVLGEEDHEEINRRFNAISHFLNLCDSEVLLVGERIRAFPTYGEDNRFTKTTSSVAESTEFPAEIIDAAKQLEAEAGLPVALIGLDHAGLIHGGDFNAREAVVQTLTQVGKIVNGTGAATMVLAHSPKTAVGKDEADQNDVTGSAAWVDLTRGSFILRSMSLAEAKELGVNPDIRENYVSLTAVKANYGPKGFKIWMERQTLPNYSVSVLQWVSLSKPLPINPRHSLSSKVKIFIGQHPGQYTKTSLRDTQGGTSGQFKVGKHQVAAAVEDLLASSEIQLVPPTPEQRAKFGLHAQVTQVLEVI